MIDDQQRLMDNETPHHCPFCGFAMSWLRISGPDRPGVVDVTWRCRNARCGAKLTLHERREGEA